MLREEGCDGRRARAEATGEASLGRTGFVTVQYSTVPASRSVAIVRLFRQSASSPFVPVVHVIAMAARRGRTLMCWCVTYPRPPAPSLSSTTTQSTRLGWARLARANNSRPSHAPTGLAVLSSLGSLRVARCGAGQGQAMAGLCV